MGSSPTRLTQAKGDTAQRRSAWRKAPLGHNHLYSKNRSFHLEMTQKYTHQLFPNSEIYQKNTSIPPELEYAIQKIPPEKIGDSQIEQIKAQQIIKNWVITVWQVAQFLIDKQNFTEKQKKLFLQEFQKALHTFIIHPDHGILHSYFVYRGMLYLSELHNQPIQPETTLDKQAQLVSLFHDFIQVIPYTITENRDLIAADLKNEHAQIMATLIRMFGQSVGFDSQTTESLAFSIEQHDSSYNNVYHENFDFLSQLLHDSDKLFGASYKTDSSTLAIQMLKRNYQVNHGPKGSYLLRVELNSEYRKLFEYGDRCWNDCVAVITKELEITMYTQIGKQVAQQRKRVAVKKAHQVYSHFFDITIDCIQNQVVPALTVKPPHLALTVVGMNQPEIPLAEIVQNAAELELGLNKLYNTPIMLNNAQQFAHRYNSKKDARGLKIRVINTTTNTENYIDPSIGRFCLLKNGKELFLQEVLKAFQERLELEPGS